MPADRRREAFEAIVSEAFAGRVLPSGGGAAEHDARIVTARRTAALATLVVGRG